MEVQLFNMMHIWDVYTDRKVFLLRLFVTAWWCFGLIAGYRFAQYSSAGFVSMMHMPIVTAVSIVGRYTMLILPFVIVVISSQFNLRFINSLILFCKAFLYAYSSCSIIALYGSSGWLCRLLLLFFDFCTLPALIYICIRIAKRELEKRDFVITLIYVFTITCIDYFAILPFAVRLLHH